jgi:hypothetical protein
LVVALRGPLIIARRWSLIITWRRRLVLVSRRWTLFALVAWRRPLLVSLISRRRPLLVVRTLVTLITGRRRRRHGLPRPVAILHIRVISRRVLAIVPVARRALIVCRLLIVSLRNVSRVGIDRLVVPPPIATSEPPPAPAAVPRPVMPPAMLPFGALARCKMRKIVMQDKGWSRRNTDVKPRPSVKSHTAVRHCKNMSWSGAVYRSGMKPAWAMGPSVRRSAMEVLSNGRHGQENASGQE